MDNNLLYYPTDLVLSNIIEEEVDRLIETLDIQKKDTIEPMNNNSILDTFITKGLTITKTINNTQKYIKRNSKFSLYNSITTIKQTYRISCFIQYYYKSRRCN